MSKQEQITAKEYRDKMVNDAVRKGRQLMDLAKPIRADLFMDQIRIQVAPMTVNRAWQGKRYKTKRYEEYEIEMLHALPKDFVMPPEPPYGLEYRVGFSRVDADLGNIEKPLTDILCKKYGFNDRDVFRIVLEKQIVKRGEEFVRVRIYPWRTDLGLV